MLGLLAQERDGLTLSELTAQTDIPKSTLFRILATLEHRGCVHLDEGTKRYRLGLKMWELGSAYIEQSDLDSAATPYMQGLAETCGESVFLGTLDDGDVVYVRRIESPQSIAVVRKLGHRVPVYCTATGEAMLAFLPDEDIERVVEGLNMEAHTASTNTDRDTLRRRLDTVRADGVAVVDGEYNPNLLCVSAPVLDSTGHVRAAITVAMLSSQTTDERVADVKRHVRRATQSVSRELGYLDKQPTVGKGVRPSVNH